MVYSKRYLKNEGKGRMGETPTTKFREVHTLIKKII
jgi:hypothetical protein